MRKTVKLITKRIRVTRRKKVLHRLSQQGHFKSKENPDTRRKKRNPKKSESSVIRSAIKKYTDKL
jgi:hypothetical protein